MSYDLVNQKFIKEKFSDINKEANKTVEILNSFFDLQESGIEIEIFSETTR
jgi:hypothetical protein